MIFVQKSEKRRQERLQGSFYMKSKSVVAVALAGLLLAAGLFLAGCSMGCSAAGACHVTIVLETDTGAPILDRNAPPPENCLDSGCLVSAMNTVGAGRPGTHRCDC